MQIYLQKRKGQLAETRKSKGAKRKEWLLLIYHFGHGMKRQYEHLKLFVYEKPTTTIEKEHNKETLIIAEQIRAKRLLEMQAQQYGLQPTFKRKASFIEFFKNLVKEKRNSIENAAQWESLLKHLLNFVKDREVRFEEVNEIFLENFKQYLLKEPLTKSGRQLSNNTAVSYFNRIKTALKEAYMQRVITDNPGTRVKCIKEIPTRREYLTFEELQLLSKTDCEIPVLKNAFMFSSLTGLRHSDIKKMTWNELHYEENMGWVLRFTQQKTKQVESLPISEQAIKFIDHDLEFVKQKCQMKSLQNELVFKGLSYDAWMNKKLKNWIKEAGITKQITFHIARHSFATLQLSLNTDMATVSKLLGHKNLKTTQIYAKVLDASKVAAVNKIPTL